MSLIHGSGRRIMGRPLIVCVRCGKQRRSSWLGSFFDRAGNRVSGPMCFDCANGLEPGWRRPKGRKIDHGQKRLYKAESLVFKHVEDGMIPNVQLDEDQTRAFVDHVYKELGNTRRPMIEHAKIGRGGAYARVGMNTLHFSRGAALPWKILHEIAHLLAPPDEGHGPRFVALYLDLVRKFLGRAWAEDLARAFQEKRVRM